MLIRVSTVWPKFFLMRGVIPAAKTNSSSFVQSFNSCSSLGLGKMSQEAKTIQMPGQHDPNDKHPSDFPNTNTTSPITTPTDIPAVPDSPFVPDFNAIPPIRPGEDPPTPSPSPTAPRSDGPEVSVPPNTSQPNHEAPRPPLSPPGQPEAFPPHAPDAMPPKPPEPREQIRSSNIRSE